MRIIFMGTPELAVPTLERIADSKHEIVAVVTQTDKESGRGRKVLRSRNSPLKEGLISCSLRA